jgi:hypothetical protein
VQLDNALYALAQIVHNFGAVAVVGLPLAALRFGATGDTLRRTYLFALAGWLAQVASGMGFGLVSYFIVEELPQVSGLALGALYLKIACATVAIPLLVVLLSRPALPARAALRALAGLGATALFSAAVLRWFS